MANCTPRRRSGYFGLGLNVSQERDQNHLDYRIAVTKKLRVEFTSGVTYSAIVNLQGIFLFYRKKISDSIKCFKEVLDHDQFNVNAMANLLVVYQRLSRNSLSQKYNEQLDGLEKNENMKLSEVKALIEQGFAFQFDCYRGEDEWDRASKSYVPFKKALELLQKIDSSEERDKIEGEIKYWFAQTCQRIHHGWFRRYLKPKICENENPWMKGASFLWDIVKNDDAPHPDVIKAGAWAYLGVFLFKKSDRTKDVENVLREQCIGIDEYMNNIEACFKKALEISESSTEVYIRYATYLSDLSRKTGQVDKIDAAIEQLNKAINIDSEDGNWFSLTTLALNYSKKSRRTHKIENLTDDERKKMKKECIESAIENWEKSVKINATAMDLGNLGEAYHHRADINGDLDSDSEDIIRATECFYDAIQILGTEKKPDVHRQHARFLSDIGEKRQALESYKRAMEIDTADKPTQSFEQLFTTFLKMYEEERYTDSESSDDGQSETENDGQTQKKNDGQPQTVDSHDGQLQTEDGDQDQTYVKQGIDTEMTTPVDVKSQASADSHQEPMSKPLQESSLQDESKSKISSFSDGHAAVAMVTETQQSKQKTIDDDIELDAQPSQESNNATLEQESGTKLKRFKYKDNSILYEIAYWYRFACERYKDKIDDITEKAFTKNPQEIAMLAAYYSINEGTKKLAQKLEDIVMKDTEEKAEKAETAEEAVWESMFSHAAKLLEEKKKDTDNTPEGTESVFCKDCHQPIPGIPNLSISRQNSSLPNTIERPRNITFDFDFYVIFNEKEQEWVYYSLLSKLEANYGFKGAVPERDFRPGHDQLSEMARCIKKSFKILIVLRAHMEEHDRNQSMYQMTLAKQIGHSDKRDHFIIPILLDSNCCPPIQLSTLICVNAVEKYAWDKIVRSLEHR